MNLYPENNSVIIINNIRIHHDNELIILLQGLECYIIFLLLYFSDYNSIKTAFSTIKSWIRRNRDIMEAFNDPIHALLVACSQITSQMAQSFFEASIYI